MLRSKARRTSIQKTAGEVSAERVISSIINKSWPILTIDTNTQLAHMMVAARNADGIIGAQAWTDWIASLGGVVDPLATQVGKSILETGLTSGVAHLGFTNIDAASIKYAQTQGSKLITNLQESQRETVRLVMGKALQGNYTVDQAAAAIRNTIGLHPAWAQAVVTRREKQFAQLVKEGMTPAKAGALADKRAGIYRDRLVRTRAMNVARTEIQTAQNLGRYATWSQMVGYGYLSAESNKEWSPGPGACPICSALAGETVRWDQPFSTGAVMPPQHVNCRCSAVMIPVPTSNPALNARPIDWLNPLGYVTPPGESAIGLDSGQVFNGGVAAGTSADDTSDGSNNDEES